MKLKNGVGLSKVFLPKLAKQSPILLIDFLVERFPHISRENWLDRFACSLVLDSNGLPLSPEAAYIENSHIYYFRKIDSEINIPFEETIVYQDDHLIIADKPHFLPVTPGGQYLQQTLLVRLKNKTGITTLSPIHRIDRETAGLVAFSIQPQDRNNYQALFRNREVKKVYEAIAPYMEELKNNFPIHYKSRMEESDIFIQMHEISGEANSDSWIDLVECQGEWARYHLQLGTGKKHQLRLHMASLGIPIKNDQIYPNLKAHTLQAIDFNRPLQLIARELAFKDPMTQIEHHFFSKQKLSF